MEVLKQKPKSKVSWAPFYKLVSIILSTARLNYFPDNFNDKRWKKVLMISIFLLQTFIGLLCLFETILPNDYDLEEAISCFIIFVTEISIIFKVITLIYYSKTLRKLNSYILKETSRLNHNPWEFLLAKKYYKYAKIICVKIFVLYFLTMVSFVVLPALSSKDKVLPVLIELPGTKRSSRYGYVINYFFGAWNVCYGTTVEMGFDIPAFLQACFISFQLDRCANYCKMIGDFETPYNTQEKQSELLKKCIKLHTSIFDFIHVISTVITFVVALTVITVVPLLTILLYFVPTGAVSGAPFLMIACGYHLFLYCFLGEIVSIKVKFDSMYRSNKT